MAPQTPCHVLSSIDITILNFTHSSQVGGFGLVVLRLEKMTRLAARFLDYAMSTTLRGKHEGHLAV